MMVQKVVDDCSSLEVLLFFLTNSTQNFKEIHQDLSLVFTEYMQKPTKIVYSSFHQLFNHSNLSAFLNFL
jgi:hypothetical protein